MNFKPFLYFTFIILSLSCKGKTESNNQSIQHSEIILKSKTNKDSLMMIIKNKNLYNRYLEQITFLSAADSEEDTNYKLSEKDINDVIEVINLELKGHGYKSLSDEKFYKKLKSVFSIDCKKCKIVKEHKQFYTFIFRDEAEPTINIIDSEFEYGNKNHYIIKDYNFVVPFTYIPNILTFLDENDVQSNLPENILHRNKFLFNDSKASLTWLLNNDIYYLEELLTDIGFDENIEINRKLLDNLYKDYTNGNSVDINRLGGFFASLDCDEKLKIHERLLQFIVNSTTIDNNQYYKLLREYAQTICDSNYNPTYGLIYRLSNSERLSIIAYLGYYIELIWRKCDPTGNRDWEIGSFLRNELVSNQELLKNIKSNSYYSLPNFENMIDTILDQIDIDSDEYQKTHNF